MTTNKSSFGFTKGDKEVELYKLKNGRVEMEVITYGGIIRQLKVPNREGNLVDVVLGCDNIQDYEKDKGYLGCIVGRVANRIKKGQFELNNQHYTLAVNNGPNHLHGGVSGFNSKIWNTAHSDSSQIKLQYESPDGEEGYPGTVHTDVTYDLLDHGSTVTFTMETKATTTHPTPIDLTNHSYFNLSGENEPTIYDHDICVLCDSYLPTDDDCLVTGVVASVSSTPYDLRTKANVGDRIKQLIELKKPAFDAYYCFSDNVNRKDNVVTVYSPKTGIRMQVASTQPGFQFYTAHFLTQIGKNGHCYGKHGGACFEFQGYPDAVNNKHFPNIILNPGEIYNHITNFSFDIV